MKTFAIGEAKKDLETVLDWAQKEKVVIFRNGKPCALVMGIQYYDKEDWELANSEEFWRMIQERRRNSRLIPLAEVEDRLFGKKKNGSPRSQHIASKKKQKRRKAAKSRS